MSTLARLRAVAAVFGTLMFGAVAALLLPGPVQAGVVSLSSSAHSVSVGDSFTLSLKISGLSSAAGDSLAGFDLKLNFDAAAVSLAGFGFQDAASSRNQLDEPEIGGFGFLGDVDLGSAGVVNAFGLSGNSGSLLDAKQADDFVFLTLRFLALASKSEANFSLDIGDPALVFADSGSGALGVTFQNTDLSVKIDQNGGTLPEPSSLALAGLALLACLGRHRFGKLRRPIAGALAGTFLLLPALEFSAASAQTQQPASRAAQGQAKTPAAERGLANASAHATTSLDGLVVEVQGQRLKVRSADGTEAWFTTSVALSQANLNKRVRGQIRPLGDSQLLETPVFD